ncbi:ABC transporter permease [Bacillus cereus]|nr:ABC transporter permease [Bacillus cereus]PGU63586.1 ABC transporter permease [Bacillus cereus]
MMMLMKQLKLHINFHYKAFIIFWIAALLIKGITSAMDLKGIKEGFLQHILNNPSIVIIFFIVVSTFIIQDDVFRLAVSFGVTRLQFFIGAVCYIILQAAVFSFLQVILLQNTLYSIVYSIVNTSLGEHSVKQFIVQLLLYVTIATFFQVAVVIKKRFNWIGLMIGGTLFISLNSVLYTEVGIQGLNSTSNLSLIDFPYFTVISIGLTIFYIVTSGIFIRKVSFEQTI